MFLEYLGYTLKTAWAMRLHKKASGFNIKLKKEHLSLSVKFDNGFLCHLHKKPLSNLTLNDKRSFLSLMLKPDAFCMKSHWQ